MAKYGDEKVMVLPTKLVEPFLHKPFSDTYDGSVIQQKPWAIFGCEEIFAERLQPMLRWNAELNPNYRQVIPYGVIVNEDTEEILASFRIGGDERLRGMLSIGTGGHMEEGETFDRCLLREMWEEVGLAEDDISDLFITGYICASESEVDRVHVGLVYRVLTKRESLHSKEPYTLRTRYVSKDKLLEYLAQGKLESWSALVMPDQMRWSKDGWDPSAMTDWDREEAE